MTDDEFYLQELPLFMSPSQNSDNVNLYCKSGVIKTPSSKKFKSPGTFSLKDKTINSLPENIKRYDKFGEEIKEADLSNSEAGIVSHGYLDTVGRGTTEASIRISLEVGIMPPDYVDPFGRSSSIDDTALLYVNESNHLPLLAYPIGPVSISIDPTHIQYEGDCRRTVTDHHHVENSSTGRPQFVITFHSEPGSRPVLCSSFTDIRSLTPRGALGTRKNVSSENLRGRLRLHRLKSNSCSDLTEHRQSLMHHRNISASGFLYPVHHQVKINEASGLLTEEYKKRIGHRRSRSMRDVFYDDPDEPILSRSASDQSLTTRKSHNKSAIDPEPFTGSLDDLLNIVIYPPSNGTSDQSLHESDEEKYNTEKYYLGENVQRINTLTVNEQEKIDHGVIWDIKKTGHDVPRDVTRKDHDVLRDVTRKDHDVLRDVTRKDQDFIQATKKTGRDATQDVKKKDHDVIRDVTRKDQDFIQATKKTGHDAIRDVTLKDQDFIQATKKIGRDAIRDVTKKDHDVIRDVTRKDQDFIQATKKTGRDATRDVTRKDQDCIQATKKTGRDATRDVTRKDQDFIQATKKTGRDVIRDVTRKDQDVIRDEKKTVHDIIRDIKRTNHDVIQDIKQTNQDIRGDIKDNNHVENTHFPFPSIKPDTPWIDQSMYEDINSSLAIENQLDMGDDDMVQTPLFIHEETQSDENHACDTRSNGCKIKMTINVTLAVISIFVYLADIGTDILLAREYFMQGEFSLFWATVVFILVPSALLAIVDLSWFYQDQMERIGNNSAAYVAVRIVFGVASFGRIFRTMEYVYHGYKWIHATRFSDQEYHETRSKEAARDFRLLDLINVFTESAPQFLLQLIITLYSHDVETVRALSLATSWVSIAWTLVSYYDCNRAALPGRNALTIQAYFLYLMAKLSEVSSRIVSVSLFIFVFKIWGVSILLHLVIMAVWVFCIQKPELEGIAASNLGKALYKLFFSYVLLVCYINLRNDPTLNRMIFYHTLTYTENFAMGGLVLWQMASHDELTNKYQVLFLIAIPLGFLFHVIFQAVFYRCCHSWSEEAASMTNQVNRAVSNEQEHELRVISQISL
ncbi:hypothetical protein ACJMK2_008613 [Sinanodonta woodiana]|uniref:XK-related protein n=1 Tax=Sinanodonta woodiana TaxID=1069815 RepID=A0ABD3VM49_SINWO